MFVVGVGMTKVTVCRYNIFHQMNFSMLLILQFEKPGRREDFDYPQMAKEAGKHEGACNMHP